MQPIRALAGVVYRHCRADRRVRADAFADLHPAALIRSRLVAGALVSLLCCSPGFAQDAPSSVSPDDKVQLTEIVVTAQRRTQNVQDVPIAISVVSGETLSQTGFKNVRDLQFVVPGVQYDPANGSGFQIRGVGTQVFDYSAEQDRWFGSATPLPAAMALTAGIVSPLALLLLWFGFVHYRRALDDVPATAC